MHPPSQANYSGPRVKVVVLVTINGRVKKKAKPTKQLEINDKNLMLYVTYVIRRWGTEAYWTFWRCIKNKFYLLFM